MKIASNTLLAITEREHRLRRHCEDYRGSVRRLKPHRVPTLDGETLYGSRTT